MWKAVPSHQHIEVSEEGLVRAAPLIGVMPKGGIRLYGGGDGYPGAWTGKHYHIRSKRSKATLKVARLVCEAFHGPAPEGKPYVLHRDEDARNNRPENVYWGTQKENLNMPGFIAYCRTRTGENHPRKKVR